MYRFQTAVLLLLTLALFAGCGDNDDPPGAPTPPTLIESTITGTVTPFGGQTYVFSVTRVGQINARITRLGPEPDPDVEPDPDADVAVVGLSLGTWTPNACQILLANDNATQNTNLQGNATTVGNFCVRVYDVGTLTEPIDFEIALSHF